MKKLFALQVRVFSFSLFFFLISIQVFAQVGIGTITPNDDALLDIDASGTVGGLLLPRVALTNTNSPAPLSAHVAGMTVYNTATAGDVTPGYYYNDGSDWMRIASQPIGEGWGCSGNNGTTTGTNFLGTIDSQGFRLRTRNMERFEISDGDAITGGRLRAFTNGTAISPIYSWNANQGTGMFQQAANVLGFSTNGIERIRIIENGRIGINEATPLGFLQVTSPLFGSLPAGGPGIYSTISVNNSNWFAVEANNPNVVGGGGIIGNGFFGVRGNTTDLALGWAGYFNGDIISRDNYVDRDIWALFGTSELGNVATDDLTVWGTFTNPSDARIKSNIHDITNALSILSKLSPKMYQKNINLINRGNAKKDSNIESQSNTLIKDFNINKEGIGTTKGQINKKSLVEFGLIAQEIEKILPELVREKKTNVEGLGVIDLKSVNYIGLIPILIQGIQEQQQIIDSQETRIAKLELMVQKLIDMK